MYLAFSHVVFKHLKNTFTRNRKHVVFLSLDIGCKNLDPKNVKLAWLDLNKKIAKHK